jgi:hypothetical protein
MFEAEELNDKWKFSIEGFFVPAGAIKSNPVRFEGQSICRPGQSVIVSAHEAINDFALGELNKLSVA